MKTPVIIVLVMIIVLIGGFFLINRQSRMTPNSAPSPTQSIPISGSPNTNTLEQGGSSYLDPKGVYSFLYPSDWKQDLQGNGTRIYKTGPSQTGQTEMFDGVLMYFEDINLGGTTLSAWVDQHIKETTADGTLKVTEPKTATTAVNSYPGFTYATRGLGEAKYYVVQKDSTSPNAVIITTAVMDPKNVGFEQQVLQVLATLKLLK